MEEKIISIVNEMAEYLNVSQLKKLQETSLRNLSENEAQRKDISNEELIKNIQIILAPLFVTLHHRK